MIRRPPAPLLYEAVGLGMAAYASLVHRAVLLGAERLRLEPAVVLASTHLSDDRDRARDDPLGAMPAGPLRRPDAPRGGAPRREVAVGRAELVDV